MKTSPKGGSSGLSFPSIWGSCLGASWPLLCFMKIGKVRECFGLLRMSLMAANQSTPPRFAIPALHTTASSLLFVSCTVLASFRTEIKFMRSANWASNDTRKSGASSSEPWPFRTQSRTHWSRWRRNRTKVSSAFEGERTVKMILRV